MPPDSSSSSSSSSGQANTTRTTVSVASIAAQMNEKFGENWALSGGRAMAIYQDHLGLHAHRESTDIDLVVPDAIVEKVAVHLSGTTGKSVDLKRTKSTVSGVHVKSGDTVTSTHIDVLPCSAFGSPCGGKKIVQHHAYLMDTETIRLLPPTHLLNRKVQTANEIAEQLTDLQQPISDDLMKAIKDVLALVEIKKTMESRAGQAGLPFVTPVEPPSPNTQRLSEGIDLMALHSSSMTQSSPPRATAGGGQGRSMFSQSATTSASSQPSSLMSLFGKL